MSDRKVFIVSAARTPIGSFCGCLSTLKASDLGAIVIKAVISRANLSPNEISEVILGQALTAGQGQNPSRQAALSAGLPETTPAFCVNMLCGSGLKAILLGYQSIKCGDSSAVVCGGQENMSLAPHVIPLRTPIKMGNAQLVDTMLLDGLTDAMNNIHMGVTAENIAEKYKISREEQDAYASKSQNKTEVAQSCGFFSNEIISVTVPDRKGSIVISKDEYPKSGTTIEGLAKLKPVFVKNGTVTAGNASGINDGAAAVLLVDMETVKSKNLTPLAAIVATSQAGVDPLIMGTGPIPAVQSVLSKAGWTLNDVDLFELNEAFAVQALAVAKELGVDQSKVNINGGAIALGHPIGASGARVLVTLLYALQRTGGKKGIAALCIGGGMGIAIAVERVDCDGVLT